MTNQQFWRGRRVFLTGHTGFKGAWLSLWLSDLGADVTGYALNPPTQPSLFDLAGVSRLLTDIRGDIRDRENFLTAVQKAAPEVVIHMAAQPLVRESYKDPYTTYGTNVMGTVNLLDAVRQTPSVRAAVIVTTDKCYENREWVWGYRENEPMGGFDPYSSSKGCAELVTAAYRNSFFPASEYGKSHTTAIASARAGNVIGGGDWAADRLVPDIVRSISSGQDVRIRNPNAVRPWQHVLEPLSGYLTLAERLYHEGPAFAEGWNFGPSENDAKPVEWIVKRLCSLWGEGASYAIDPGPHPHEANLLRLDCSKARQKLGWAPAWDLGTALSKIAEWSRVYVAQGKIRETTVRQIRDYSETRKKLQENGR